MTSKPLQEQYYLDLVLFLDFEQDAHSVLCQPRDIHILEGPNTKGMKEEIAVDIREGQGCPESLLRKNLKFTF